MTSNIDQGTVNGNSTYKQRRSFATIVSRRRCPYVKIRDLIASDWTIARDHTNWVITNIRCVTCLRWFASLLVNILETASLYKNLNSPTPGGESRTILNRQRNGWAETFGIVAWPPLDKFPRYSWGEHDWLGDVRDTGKYFQRSLLNCNAKLLTLNITLLQVWDLLVVWYDIPKIVRPIEYRTFRMMHWNWGDTSSQYPVPLFPYPRIPWVTTKSADLNRPSNQFRSQF
jgi:hypothetical protein